VCAFVCVHVCASDCVRACERACACACACVDGHPNLELVPLDDPARLHVLSDLAQHGQHGDVGLAGAGRSTDEQVLVGVVGRLEHDGLDAVQTLHPLEHQLPDLDTHTHARKHTHTHTHTRTKEDNAGKNEFLNQPLFYVLSKLGGSRGI